MSLNDPNDTVTYTVRVSDVEVSVGASDQDMTLDAILADLRQALAYIEAQLDDTRRLH